VSVVVSVGFSFCSTTVRGGARTTPVQTCVVLAFSLCCAVVQCTAGWSYGIKSQLLYH
jgi:hypothetical protein